MKKLQAIVSGLLLLLASVYLLFFVEPASIYIVVLFILLVTLLTYVVSAQFLARRYQILIVAFVSTFLTMNYMAGFQILNTIFLISIIIGITVLIK